MSRQIYKHRTPDLKKNNSIGKINCISLILTLEENKYKYQIKLWVLKQTILMNNSRLSLQFYFSDFILE